jgi:hypothetical protein
MNAKNTFSHDSSITVHYMYEKNVKKKIVKDKI